MSRVITNSLRHNSSAGDNLTLDGTGNVTATGNLNVTGTSTLTNDLVVDTDTLFVDVSADRVGVNTSVPSGALTVQGGTNESNVIRVTDGANYTMELGRSLDNTGSFGYIGGTGNTGLTLGADNTEVIRIATDGTVQLRNSPGIDFSQIQTNVAGMTSETLDSYEEGTWTPTEFYKSGFTGNLTVHNATYTKIGNKVQIYLEIEYATAGAAQTGWRAYFSGLPFTPAQTTPSYGENTDNTSSVILWRGYCSGSNIITYVVVLAGGANGASRFRIQADYFV